MRCALEYGEKHEGIPLIERARYWSQDGDKIWDEESVERVDVNLEPAPPEAFMLSAFGVPDEIIGPPANQRDWRFMLVILGILGLITAVAVAWLAKRKASEA